MRVTRHKGQILFFLAAILAPAGFLIGLAGRIMHQDRELAAKRHSDQRAAAVAQLRRELSTWLENIKLREINRLIRPDATAFEDPAVIFTAKLLDDRLVFPWEFDAADSQGLKEFAEHRDAGEAAEMIKKNYADTATHYRQAIASARRPAETAEARRLMARSLSKAGNQDEASKQYRLLLNEPSGARDEQGVAYRLYAVERLVNVNRDLDGVRLMLS